MHIRCPCVTNSNRLLVWKWQHGTTHHGQLLRRKSSVQAAAAEQHVAVIGGGFAGLATAWHLIQHLQAPSTIHMYEGHHLGAGGSGAAAGLLHAYSPKGKLLWRGQEAMRDALELVEAAEQAAMQDDECESPFVWRTGIVRLSANSKQAASLHAAACATGEADELAPLTKAELQRLVPGTPPPAWTVSEAAPCPSPSTGRGTFTEEALEGALSAEGLPHIVLSGEDCRAAAISSSGRGDAVKRTDCVALLIRNGVVLRPDGYIKALWLACQHAASKKGIALCLQRQLVTSLSALWHASRQRGVQYSDIVVAAGAAVGALPEIGDQLPLQLCQGYTLNMAAPQHGQPPASQSPSLPAAFAPSPTFARPATPAATMADLHAEDGCAGIATADACSTTEETCSPLELPSKNNQFPSGAPSLLGSPYIACHGPDRLVVGATKQYGGSAEDALQECARGVLSADDGGAAAAAKGLLPQAVRSLWSPLAGWQIASARSGVRALPPRTADGALPLLGRLPAPHWIHSVAGLAEGEHHAQLGQAIARAPRVWIVAGLGSRGLVYHAMLGRLTAQAVVDGSEACIPPELIRWHKYTDSSTQVN